MRRLLSIAGLAVLATGLTVSGFQQSATVSLKSGSTLSGELVDLGGSGFTFRVNGQERQIPRDDVAFIDFGGGDLDVPQAARELQSGTNLAILKSGETVQGQFYDIGGAAPIQITFRTSSGERVISGNDIRRIYMTAAPGSPATASASAGGGNVAATVNVSARQWTNTGLTVRQGERLTFHAEGQVTFAPGRTAGPGGSGDNLFDTKSPVPTALQGSLVGRIGGSRAARAGAFAIGGQQSVVMPADGVLFLGVNDSGLDDNQGQFTVKISR
jgi:hypothetical protein